MSTKIRIAFYAPLKPPDHPIPSGDRQMARMLLIGLLRAGYDAFLASRLITYSKRPGLEHMQARKKAAAEEADRLISNWEMEGGRPDLWFCYHPYDKSPDWLGMEICDRLGIAMITAEPCKTGQGPNGEWIPWREEAQRGISMADMNIVMTPADFEYLSGFVDRRKIARMDPFIDIDLLENAPLGENFWPADRHTVRLLTVGMMRPGAKLESYRVLGEALRGLARLDWSLVVAGGGPCREAVEAMFQPEISDRVRFTGEVEASAVPGLMAKADILVWPGYREAYGMVYLEAASQGIPAVALDNMGVPLVVIDGKTGLLADPEIDGSYRAALERMISNAPLRRKLGEGAARFVREERSAETAAMRLKQIVNQVFAGSGKTG